MLFIAATNAKRDATTILIYSCIIYFKIAELRKTTTVRTKSVCTHAGGVCLKREYLSLSIILLFRYFEMWTLKVTCIHG